MSRVEKGPEPSMEDILASIRKIIAEDPIGSRPSPQGNAPRASVPQPSQPAAASEPVAAAPKKATEQASLDDILSMADEVPTSRQPVNSHAAEDPAPAQPAVPPSARPGTDAAPSWLFPKTGQQSAPASTPASAPAPATSSARQATAAAPAPFFNGAPARSNSPVATAAKAPMAASEEPEFVNGHDGHEPVVAAAPFEAIVPAKTSAPAESLPYPSAPRSAAVSQPARTPAPAPAAKSAQPPKSQERVSKPVTETKPAPATEPVVAPVVEPVKPVEASVAAAPAVEQKDPGSAISAPVLMGAPLPAPVPLTAKPTGLPLGMTTVEERVVELLRPMVREWLDNNMTRMLERALTIELASSVKPKSPLAKN